MTGIFVASALVMALALIALVVHRRGRRAHATGPDAPGASLVTTRGDSPTYAIGPGPDDLPLVPFSEGRRRQKEEEQHGEAPLLEQVDETPERLVAIAPSQPSSSSLSLIAPVVPLLAPSEPVQTAWPVRAIRAHPSGATTMPLASAM